MIKIINQTAIFFCLILTVLLIYPKTAHAVLDFDSWQVVSQMPNPRLYHSSVVVGDYIYVIGGSDGINHLDTVQRVKVNEDGSLGNWESMPSLVIPLAHSSAVVYGNYIYLSGGSDGKVPVNIVQRAKINQDQTIGSWEVISHMLENLQHHSMVAARDNLYVMGGYNGSSPAIAKVEIAQINGDGSIGTWNFAPGMLTPRSTLISVTDGKQIYALGGNSNYQVSNVEQTIINPDGSLGPWSEGTPMKQNRFFLGSEINSGNVFAGGGSYSCSLNSIETSAVKSGAILDDWTNLPNMTTVRKGLTLAFVKSYLYAIGGQNNCGSEINLESVEGLKMHMLKQNYNPVVFIPGLLGSWSHKGLIENQPTTYNDWQLLPIFSDASYKPLIDTFLGLGLIKNQNFFVFGYDYRKSIKDSAQSLNTFLTNEVLQKNPGQKINIIGHSMGGLVVHYCFEKVSGCADKIDKIITGGSPHQGTLAAYDLWEGGKFKADDPVQRVTFLAFLRANGLNKLTNKDIIQQIAPGIKDLLPIFDYITGKPYANLSGTAKNTTLESIRIPSIKLLTAITTLSGSMINSTDRIYTTVSPTNWEKSLGLWQDGKPTSTTKDIGDGTVLGLSSAVSGSIDKKYLLEHKEYFNNTNSLTDLLTLLNLNGNPIITSPHYPKSILAFILHSPAAILVKDQNGSLVGTKFDDETVFIQDPSIQIYEIVIKGTGDGDFKLDQIFSANNQDFSQTLAGSIKVGQTRSYKFKYTGSSNSTIIDPVGDNFFESYKNIIQQVPKDKIDDALSDVTVHFQKTKQKSERNQALMDLRDDYYDLERMISNENASSIRLLFINAAEVLLNLNTALNQEYGPVLSKSKAESSIVSAKKKFDDFAKKSNLSSLQSANLYLANQYLDQANLALGSGDNFKSQTLAIGINSLLH